MNFYALLRPRAGCSACWVASRSAWVSLGLLCMAWPSQGVMGQFMLSPVGVNTELGTFSQDATALTNLINQSGLNVPFVSGTTDFDSYFAPPNSNFSRNVDRTKWQSDVSFELPFGGPVDFDLGVVYLVSKVAIWNISVKSLSVLVATESTGPWLDVGKFSLSDHQSSLSLRAEVLDLGAERSARYLRLSIESEFPAIPSVTFGYITIGEVVVRAASASQPTVSIRQETSGDLTVEFTGVLQQSTDINGPFLDVPGQPAGKFPIPKDQKEQLPHQFFRSRK